MRRRLLAASAVAAALALGFAGGRLTAPRLPIIEQSRERTAMSTGSTAMSHKSSNEAINWSLVDDAYQSADVSYYPNGAVKRVRTKQRKKQEQKGAVSVATDETKYLDHHHYHVREVEKLVLREPSLPRLSLGVLGGWSYSGARVYGGTADIRIAGGLWAGVNVTTQAALMSLRWEF